MFTLQEATSEFLNYCRYEKNLSPKTIKFYRIDLTQLAAFLSANNLSANVSEISKIQLRPYLESLSTLKPKSIKRKMATLKAMFNYLEFEDKIAANPIRKMRIKFKEPFVLPKSLSLNEIVNIFKSAYQLPAGGIDSHSYMCKIRDISVMELLFATGARVSEIANLKENDIDLLTGSVKIEGKGGKERIIQICNPDALAIIRKYKEAYGGQIESSGGYLLVNRLNKRLSDQSIRSIVRKLSSTASINRHVTPHVFRHSFATLLLENDVDIKYIQFLLGHSSITTTQIYVHVNGEKQRQILLAKHPRKDLSFPIEG
ncbi:tyrosine-type recombinase/integrase [Hufsiella ginkgonis]|uniref:Tyrosine-type recombinase/integrase n=1 Tax=Hufsiella ginkgonis TaxID=2695274 RepID=A0A7K1XT93_9SPHI|nr:tyrosine-type recombinase/integrase [Hufsiella ginkgonis]MXV13999.1 tyrosine-type recombinase/integrase [Hufsiella ginkgonis]